MQHSKNIYPKQGLASALSVHRYGRSRSWLVVALAILASAGTATLAGAVEVALPGSDFRVELPWTGQALR